MQSFRYHSPTEVLFGKNAEDGAAEAIKKYGGTRVFVVYGGGSAARSGLLGRITKQLDDAGLASEALGGVQPNPRLTLAREGVRRAASFGADFILAVGGGSVIDTAKAIAHGVANPGVDIWKFWTREAELKKSMPVGAVLTISAAGSETSDSAVLTNEEARSKRGLSTEFNRPRFAVMNPELTYSLPRFQVGCGVVDIMMHTLDRYFTPTEGNEMTDEIAEALLRTAVKHGRTAMANPTDYEAMSELMWAGSLSHNGLTGLGAAMDFSTHQLGHELSAKFDAAHGASLSAVWGSWALYSFGAKPARFARYARKVWGIDETNDEAAARAGIEATVAYFKSIDMPTCFSELGVGLLDEQGLRELAENCMFRGGRKSIGSFKVLAKEDVYQIYKLANR